jgi:hypothetical protein
VQVFSHAGVSLIQDVSAGREAEPAIIRIQSGLSFPVEGIICDGRGMEAMLVDLGIVLVAVAAALVVGLTMRRSAFIPHAIALVALVGIIVAFVVQG